MGLNIEEGGILNSKDDETEASEDQSATDSMRRGNTEATRDLNKIDKISFITALKIPGIIAFSMSFFFIKLSCAAIYYWYPTFLQE